MTFTLGFISFDSASEVVDEFSDIEDWDPPDRLGTGIADVMLPPDDDDDAVMLSCTITGMKVRFWVRRLIRDRAEDVQS